MSCMWPRARRAVGRRLYWGGSRALLRCSDTHPRDGYMCGIFGKKKVDINVLWPYRLLLLLLIMCTIGEGLCGGVQSKAPYSMS